MSSVSDWAELQFCVYIPASAIFHGFEPIWELFCESDPDFCWGTNNHTLVDAKSIMDHLMNTEIDVPPELQGRFQSADQVYIDLES